MLLVLEGIARNENDTTMQDSQTHASTLSVRVSDITAQHTLHAQAHLQR